MNALGRRARQLNLIFSAKSKRRLALAAVGSVLVALMETGSILLVAPLLQLLMGASVDEGVLGQIRAFTGTETRDGLLFVLLSAVVGGFIVKDVFTLAFRWWMTGFITRERANTYVALLGYFLKAPYSLHLDRSTAQMMRVLATSTGQVFGLVALGAVGVVTESITVLIIGLALIVTAPTYTIGLMVFLGLTAIVLSRSIRQHAAAAGRRQLELSEAGYKTAFHALGGAKEIKIRHAHDHYLDIYRGIETEAAHTHRVLGFLSELPKHVLEIAFFVAFLLLTAVVVTTQGSDSLVTSIGILAAGAFRVMPALSRLIVSSTNVRAGLPALDDVAGDLQAQQDLPPVQPPAVDALPFDDSIVVHDLAFRYAEGLPDVLSDVGVEIPAGTTAAFVGASGAGKSTLVDTVLGLHAPVRGAVLVDGRDIREDLAAWHANIAVVPQEVFLLDATIRENIAFDQQPDDIDDELVADVLRRAELTELVEGLQERALTMVGERGARLSGGQRQRLGLARALYRRPKLLVLDEATSALDNETERKITETIASLHGSVTVLVVAHRLSTVRDADMVVFMSDGRIEARGTFDEVLKSSAEFANLVKLGQLSRNGGGHDGI